MKSILINKYKLCVCVCDEILSSRNETQDWVHENKIFALYF